MSLFALKSSHHANRTPTDSKTERAYHLLKFIGTDREPFPPSFASAPLARRRLVPPPEITEEDRRNGFDKAERKPGESQETYELRLRFRNRKRQEEWKWAVEGQMVPGGGRASAQAHEQPQPTRYEGTEDLTQSSLYVVLIPMDDEEDEDAPPGSYKVALVDQWVDLRKHFDQTAMKERLAEVRKHKQMRATARENELESARMEEDEVLRKDDVFAPILKRGGQAAASRAGGAGGAGAEGFSWVRGQEAEDRARSKRYKRTGVLEDEQDDDYGAEGGYRRRKSASGGGGGGDDDDGEDGDDDDENGGGGGQVDHEHTSAIDRMALDPDEFGDGEHEFDDDDDGAGDGMGEGMAGLQEGLEITAQAEALEANRQVADEDDDADMEEDGGPARSNSPDSSDSDTEQPQQKGGKPAVNRTPMFRTSTATAAAAPQQYVAPVQQQQRPLTLKERMAAYIADTTRRNNGRLSKAFLISELSAGALAHFGDKFDAQLLTQVVKEVLDAKKNSIDGDFYVLKPAYQ